MTDIIKEFLVSLGFQIDENSLNKFVHGVERTTEEVVALGAEVVATALAIQVGVSKMATEFEKLYFASERTHTSVTALQSFEYAARTIGLSGDQARNSIEGLFNAMRSNPGVGALLNNLGVKTAGREGTDVLDDFVEKLSKMPFYIAQQYAAIAGVDGGALYQLIKRHKELKDAEDDRKKRIKESGVDEKALADESHKYNNELRHLEDNLGILGEQIASKFLPWLEKLTTVVDTVVEGFIKVNKATDGWAGALGTIATGGLGVYLGKLLLMKTLFRGIATEAAAAGTAAATAAGGAAAVSGGAVAGSSAFASLLAGGSVGAALGVLLGIKADANHGNTARTWLRGKLGISDPGEASPYQKTKASEVIKFFTDKGWSREQATGIAANVGVESSFKPGLTGDGGQAFGLAQWHPDRQANFAKWAGHDIHESTTEEQLGFIHYELTKGAEQFAGRMLKAANSAGDAGAVVSKFYERPQAVSEAAVNRGRTAQTWYDASLGEQSTASAAPIIHQKNEFNVHTSDPGVAAKKVNAAQGQANADLVRNIGPVTR